MIQTINDLDVHVTGLGSGSATWSRSHDWPCEQTIMRICPCIKPTQRGLEKKNATIFNGTQS